jgi:type 1 glutamine amidotransferase
MCRSILAVLLAVLWLPAGMQAQKPAFHVLAFYSTHEEADHVEFALQAVTFFSGLAHKDRFTLDTTTDWSRLNAATLSRYQVVLWLDGSPVEAQERDAFAAYMEHGGAWMGFHAAGYNDSSTHWPWFARFMGGVFYGNSWPPLPATLFVDEPDNTVTHKMPRSFLSPANEWYSWKPDPRAEKNIRVLLTLAASNFPIGFKDNLTGGDVPVVWSNTHYRMIYMNMGHGDKIFTSPEQNALFENALLWLGRGKP